SLYVAFRLTCAVGAWAEARKGGWRPRLAARGVLLLFLALCYGYYRLCLEVGYVMAWSFLAGFLPVVPVVVVAARARRGWLGVFAGGVGFAAYFWRSGLLPGWKDQCFGCPAGSFAPWHPAAGRGRLNGVRGVQTMTRVSRQFVVVLGVLCLVGG